MSRTQLIAIEEQGQHATGPVLMGVIDVISAFTQADEGKPACIQLRMDSEETTDLIGFNGVGEILVETDCDLDMTEITTAVAAKVGTDPNDLHISVDDDDVVGDDAA